MPKFRSSRSPKRLYSESTQPGGWVWLETDPEPGCPAEIRHHRLLVAGLREEFRRDRFDPLRVVTSPV